jgi:predicted extracellular nuclease
MVIVYKDPTDNLILHCILNHASQNFTDTKVLISGNKNDFGTSEVVEALRDAGIVKYFASTQSFLGWLASRSQS